VKAHTKTLSVQKRNVTLLLSALIAVIPVLSQVNYASLNTTSLTGQKTRFAENFPKYSALIKPPASQFHSAAEFFFASLAAENNNTEKKTGYSPGENNNETTRENLEIIFKPTSFTYPENSKADIGAANYPASQLILYAKALKQYAKKNYFDTSYVFLANMGMLSNKKRFFVVNLVTMEIEQSGLVSHGRGQGPSVYDKQYSNESGSKCTSLGRYKILNKYKGVYGEAYRMAGLDSSNQNAYSRNIVLHSMGCIPYTDGIMPACISEGCPAVSIEFLSSLRKIIDTRKKPVLLWIFDSNLEEVAVEDETEKNKPGYTAINEYHNCSLHIAGILRNSQLP
jgi:hypothetical protein